MNAQYLQSKIWQTTTYWLENYGKHKVAKFWGTNILRRKVLKILGAKLVFCGLFCRKNLGIIEKQNFVCVCGGRG